MADIAQKAAPRPEDPRAGILCTACNGAKRLNAEMCCTSPTCPWWKCPCGAKNDATGANDQTNRDGTKRPATIIELREP